MPAMHTRGPKNPPSTTLRAQGCMQGLGIGFRVAIQICKHTWLAVFLAELSGLTKPYYDGWLTNGFEASAWSWADGLRVHTT